MDGFWSWFQHSLIISAFNTSAFLSICAELLHYFSMFLLVGPILIVDLRLLGIAARRQNLSNLAAETLPWVWVGLILNTISGLILMGGDAVNFSHAPPLQWKIEIIIVAVVVSGFIYCNTDKWSRMVAIPVWIKLVAFVSIMLWLGAILSSNEVPAISGLG